MPLAPRTVALSTLTLACILLSGCRVETNDNGDKKNVDISTPFGAMKVKTNDSGDTTAIGITAYPGAVPVKGGDKDGNNADVNMSFGSFHLGVKAAEFQTPDAPAKVLAFYRKDLAKRFGDVIECQSDKPVGTPTRTSEGLTCEKTRDKDHVQLGSEVFGDGLELRSGSEEHQHIVSIDRHNGGSKIGLVALDLPSHLGNHDSKDSE